MCAQILLWMECSHSENRKVDVLVALPLRVPVAHPTLFASLSHTHCQGCMFKFKPVWMGIEGDALPERCVSIVHC